MKAGIVVQARNSSTRYPKKMMHDFLGKTAIEWVMDRCQMTKVDYRIIATSTDEDDDMLAAIAGKNDWKVVRGKLQDVLNRYAEAVQAFELDIVVRITGDCILTDYRLIDFALAKYLEHKVDYLCLTNLIDGFDVEIISSRAILYADKEATLPSEREHVTPYIRDSGLFKVLSLPYGDEDLSHIHLSLDYKGDAVAIEAILERLTGRDFSYEDVVKLIKAEPRLLDGVRNIVPNEGYRKSLEEDEKFIRATVKKA